MDDDCDIISELMMSISCRRNVFLDFILTSNTNEIKQGAFSCDGSKSHDLFETNDANATTFILEKIKRNDS